MSIKQEKEKEERAGSPFFTTFLPFFIIYYHHCGSSLCVPKQITVIQLEASHLSSWLIGQNV